MIYHLNWLNFFCQILLKCFLFVSSATSRLINSDGITTNTNNNKTNNCHITSNKNLSTFVVLPECKYEVLIKYLYLGRVTATGASAKPFHKKTFYNNTSTLRERELQFYPLLTPAATPYVTTFPQIGKFFVRMITAIMMINNYKINTDNISNNKNVHNTI